MKPMYTLYTALFTCLSFASIFAQHDRPNAKFEQLYQVLPTPNVYRNAAGAPGHAYWQQRADYKIAVELDDEKRRIDGQETITYYNNSPDHLEYLWLQLDQNVRAKDSDTYKTRTGTISDKVTLQDLAVLDPTFDGGFKILKVTDEDDQDLPHTIVKTMMRINLPQVLAPGDKFTFNVDWWYNINDRFLFGQRSPNGARSGYEYFPEDDNYLYTIAQFYPRMCMYSDVDGWQNKQFLGRGEFTLTFGNFELEITVPADHAVSATGILENEGEVLTETQRDRLRKAEKEYDQPVMIITEAEARRQERSKSTSKKTWKFKADNVRDVAFASSRKFIWDAMAVKQSDGSTVMAMSMYPKEGNPLWERYSTKAVAHTLKWYSHYTFPYPYPVAWSIHTDRIGMEYPMICFNGGRPEPDGTYTERTKYGMISVIIHEVGHNYFPMIVNSDERQWTWMDEGLNSFLQYLAEQQWERDYPSRRGPAINIVDYMRGDKSNISPIMTNSESIFQFGNNAYGKPATALNILRETVMGRELFDYAFKIYANRWMFKHPSPADLFRTMEDASGIDLDWFWWGWFFTVDHVDLGIASVKAFRLNSMDPDKETELARREREKAPQRIGSLRNREAIANTQDEIDQELRDFYTDYDPLHVDQLDRQEYQEYLSSLTPEEKALLQQDKYYYEITFENIGGLVMPLILEFSYADGTKELIHIPVEIWRLNNDRISKVFPTDQPITNIVMDPYLETADTDRSNNYFPAQVQPSRFDLFKQKALKDDAENPMQRQQRAKQIKSGSN